jgi:hypothetical protein
MSLPEVKPMYGLNGSAVRRNADLVTYITW